MPMTDEERFDQVCKPALESMQIKIDAIYASIVGGTDSDRPSLIVRIDRLEQCKKSTVRAFWIAITAFIVGTANIIFDWFKK